MASGANATTTAGGPPRPATVSLSGRGRGVDWMYLTPLFLTCLPLIRIGFRRVGEGR